ncbi:hypothetical protein CBS101457_000556 [Exobasidium rhododendri]|nr:hypothetical protein CBS101457_000556 [Exobasidium rhododendri]
MRWAARGLIASVEHSTSVPLSARRITHSSRRSNEENDGQSASESRSALDEIFDSPDAFERTNAAPYIASRRSQSISGSSQNRIVSREVLGGMFDSEKYTSQLNQDWDGDGKSGKLFRPHRGDGGDPSASFFRSSRRTLGEDHREQRKAGWSGTMTPNELRTFEDVFNAIFNEDGATSGLEETLIDDGLFGSTLENASNEGLASFREKTMKKLKPYKKRAEQKRRGLASLLTEGIATEDVNEGEVEANIDRAREEIVACQTVAETWQWAAKNVWGEDRELQLEAIAKREEEELEQEVIREMEAQENSDIDTLATPQIPAESLSSQKKSDDSIEDLKRSAKESDVTESSQDLSFGQHEQSQHSQTSMAKLEEIAGPRFGLSTIYYAPVLSILMSQLRERFKSPQSALSILRIAKDLGPNSFVLGCTPRLYAQALQTRWMVLRDLQGARDTMQEAKATGILGNTDNLTDALEANHSNSFHKESRRTDEEDVRAVLKKTIKNEVRRHVVEGSAISPTARNSGAYTNQLRMVNEMNNMIQSKSFKRPSRSPPKVYTYL